MRFLALHEQNRPLWVDAGLGYGGKHLCGWRRQITERVPLPEGTRNAAFNDLNAIGRAPHNLTSGDYTPPSALGCYVERLRKENLWTSAIEEATVWPIVSFECTRSAEQQAEVLNLCLAVRAERHLPKPPVSNAKLRLGLSITAGDHNSARDFNFSGSTKRMWPRLNRIRFSWRSSASARLTVSRETPMLWAISSCVM